MLKPQYILPLADELVVDLFAGGGDLRLIRADGEQGRRRVAGQEPQQHKEHQPCRDQRQGQHQRAPENVTQHCRRPFVVGLSPPS